MVYRVWCDVCVYVWGLFGGVCSFISLLVEMSKTSFYEQSYHIWTIYKMYAPKTNYSKDWDIFLLYLFLKLFYFKYSLRSFKSWMCCVFNLFLVARQTRSEPIMAYWWHWILSKETIDIEEHQSFHQTHLKTVASVQLSTRDHRSYKYIRMDCS